MEKNIFKPKKYYDDDIKHKEIGDVKNLFDLSIDEEYHKPIRSNDSFNNNYIEYKSKGIKIKLYQLKNILI